MECSDLFDRDGEAPGSLMQQAVDHANDLLRIATAFHLTVKCDNTFSRECSMCQHKTGDPWHMTKLQAIILRNT